MHQRVGNRNGAASKCFHVSSVAFKNWTRHFGNDSVDFGPECRSSAHFVSFGVPGFRKDCWRSCLVEEYE